MGTRIHKSIGYFIPKDKFSGVIKPKYEKILDDLDYNKDAVIHFNEILKHLICTQKNRISSLFLKEKFDNFVPLEFINMIMDYDDFEGLLFQSPDLYELNRHNNAIDFYEAIKCEDDAIEQMLFKVKYLNCPIYPESKYVYLGGLDTTNCIINFEIGKSFFKSDINLLIKNNNQIKECFAPEQDKIIYMAAKAANIIEENITEVDFCNFVRPAIIQTWG
jgi:hypothetical protein